MFHTCVYYFPKLERKKVQELGVGVMYMLLNLFLHPSYLMSMLSLINNIIAFDLLNANEILIIKPFEIWVIRII